MMTKKFLSNIKEDIDKYACGFESNSQRTLIMDGDASCYEVACTCTKIDTAIRRVHLKILEAMFLTDCSKARFHITPAGCKKAGRHNLIGEKPYQGNRAGKNKPPLLEPIRQAIQGLLKDPNITVLPQYEYEADDGVMIDAYESILENKDCIVWSADKDLRSVPCAYYDIATGRIDCISDPFGYIGGSTTSTGIFKVVGHGRKFFWYQMLAGDTADNIRGIRSIQGSKIGSAKAFECIREETNESECANKVISWYRDIDQNPLPEAYMLWLLRYKDDSFIKYLKELDINQENKEFINNCWKRKWKLNT